jgi:hypothetical protein
MSSMSVATFSSNITDFIVLIIDPLVDNKSEYSCFNDLTVGNDFESEERDTSESPAPKINQPIELTALESEEEPEGFEKSLIRQESSKKRSLLVASATSSAIPRIKSRRISTYQTAADIAADGMRDLSQGIVQALTTAQPPPITRFDQCLPLLNEMREEGKLNDDDYFLYCTVLMKDERCAALFVGMAEDLRLTWLKEYSK